MRSLRRGSFCSLFPARSHETRQKIKKKSKSTFLILVQFDKECFKISTRNSCSVQSAGSTDLHNLVHGALLTHSQPQMDTLGVPSAGQRHARRATAFLCRECCTDKSKSNRNSSKPREHELRPLMGVESRDRPRRTTLRRGRHSIARYLWRAAGGGWGASGG